MRELRQGRRDRRGAALVLVMIFGVAAMALVTTMLSLSSASAKAEGSRHRDKTLYTIARYGLATGVSEVNRSREGSADLTGNGPGCILVGPDGLRGWPVRDSAGRLLGRFTTKIRTEAVGNGQTRRIMEVVVAEGEFPATWAEAQTRLADGTLRVVAAELEISVVGIAFDRNALSIRGPATQNGGQGFKYGTNPGGRQVEIIGNGVPAVNISDETAYKAFVGQRADGTFDDNVITRWRAFSGWDPTTNTATTGATAAGRRSTVTNDQEGLLNSETLTEIAQGINQRVADLIADPSSQQITNTNQTLAKGTYYVNSTLDIPSGSTLKGEGTLVLNSGMTIKGTLDWKGDVIIPNKNGAVVHVNNGGNFRVDGLLAIQGMGTANNMGVQLDQGARLSVGTDTNPGAFTILGDADTQNPIRFESGSGSNGGVHVKGIMSVMGDALTMTFDSGAGINVQGSLVLVTPDDPNAKGASVVFNGAAHGNFVYAPTNFDGAVQKLGEFFDVNGDSAPIRITSYVEDPLRRLTLLQEHVESSTSGSYGMN